MSPIYCIKLTSLQYYFLSFFSASSILEVELKASKRKQPTGIRCYFVILNVKKKNQKENSPKKQGNSCLCNKVFSFIRKSYIFKSLTHDRSACRFLVMIFHGIAAFNKIIYI